MQLYRNLSGDSGVLAYEIGADYIKVQFVKTPTGVLVRETLRR